jgi:cysteinyl-tRNA synthetase
MLRLFNTLGKKMEVFRPVREGLVTIFTCGPSVYQRAHIGNFRTFLFEDILVRYLEYLGYRVKRGMNVTDVEDKAIAEAARHKTTLKQLTNKNIATFIRELAALRMKQPDFLPRASDSVDRVAEIIEQLFDRKIAYWHQGNVYFDPLKYPRFGELYGLDMRQWPAKRRRFHRDTYPGMQWNKGDFILWHGYTEGEKVFWDTRIGKGRPSWNIQDASLVSLFFDETLSIYCGGIDNLFRHHDYTRAILESIRPYPMARYWLHGYHLHVDGKKMSKSVGNILYTVDLQKLGYTPAEIRFFLIYGHYRKTMSYSEKKMRAVTEKLRGFRAQVKKIKNKAGSTTDADTEQARRMKESFQERMDDDLDVRGAFDRVGALVAGIDMKNITPREAAGVIKALRNIDGVLQVIF